MRLAVKFFLAYSLVILVLAGIAAWSLREVAKLTIDSDAVPPVTGAEALRSATTLREAVLMAKRVDMRSLVFSDPEYAAASSTATKRIADELERLRGQITTDAQKKLLVRATEDFENYQAAVAKARALRTGGDAKNAEKVLRTEALPVADRVIENLDSLAVLTQDVLDQTQAEATAALAKARTEVEKLRTRTWEAVITAMILAVLAALAGTAFISVRVTRSLRRLSNATKALAEGAFHEPLPVGTRDEIGELAKSFNSMAARLHEVDALKEKFYATVSHELRSPLNAMQEAARLLAGKMAGPITAKQERLIAICQRGTSRLLRLVNEVLELSSINAGALPVERRPFSIEKAVRQAIDELRLEAERQGVALAVDIDPGAGNMVGDEDRIVEVVTNLTGNALRFTPAGGRVNVAVRDGGDEIRIAVIDTGIGIPAAQLPMIFERFRQAHSGKGGTGLGLAIVKALVEAHGGHVKAESQEGKGSCFTVTLPREAVPEAIESKAQHA